MDASIKRTPRQIPKLLITKRTVIVVNAHVELTDDHESLSFESDFGIELPPPIRHIESAAR